MLQLRMFRLFMIISLFYLYADALVIKKHPIDYFKRDRMVLTKAYIESHYGISARNASIEPKIIVIHATGIDDLNATINTFMGARLPHSRKDIANGGSLNVSAHFVVDRDGTVYQLMHERQMARHVIGLNYNSIGIENIGGVDHKEDLTPEQLRANAELVEYLSEKHEELTYLIGHHEYRCFEGHELWLERDANYRTVKKDPGEKFMAALHAEIGSLERAPCE